MKVEFEREKYWMGQPTKLFGKNSNASVEEKPLANHFLQQRRLTSLDNIFAVQSKDTKLFYAENVCLAMTEMKAL